MSQPTRKKNCTGVNAHILSSHGQESANIPTSHIAKWERVVAFGRGLRRCIPKSTFYPKIHLCYTPFHLCIIVNVCLTTGYYHKDIGLLQSGKPECRLFGYTRDLPSMPPRSLQDISWPKADAFVPLERGDRGKYYGYYHEAIERETERRRRELPESLRVEARDIPLL